jgi:hypothetical protein
MVCAIILLENKQYIIVRVHVLLSLDDRKMILDIIHSSLLLLVLG